MDTRIKIAGEFLEESLQQIHGEAGDYPEPVAMEFILALEHIQNLLEILEEDQDDGR